ncbi:hypothetical protein [Gordonia paraffinivorans]|uniref:hypothetical protein n=1 Tax=Gordonia paraffinivorans TaxID=175628 RepID=UPI001E5ABA97|nr:hypothetical protein [Gordonia paraffinivorans]MCD2144758.1 hypothetical protein [Gordonia paraffinivorans]
MTSTRIGITGVGHTRFGRLVDDDLSSLASAVTTEALSDAQVDDLGDVLGRIAAKFRF